MLINAIFAVLALNFIFTAYVDFRQFFALDTPQPALAKALVSAQEYDLNNRYNQAKIKFRTISGLIGLAKIYVVLLHLQQVFQKYLIQHEYGDLLLILGFILFEIFTNVPFNLYYDFVLEASFGFNKKTLSTFIKDFLLVLLLVLIIATPVIAVSLFIIRTYKDFYLFLWLFVSVVQFVIVVLYPKLIAPLFNKFKTLEEGTLQSKIFQLAKKIDFQTSQIYVMDGSKRSGHSNAYFTGFGKAKEIVFYDTILQQLNEDQVVAVLSHQLGHWAYYHTYVLMAVSMTIIFLLLFSMNLTMGSGQHLGLSVLQFYFLSDAAIVPVSFLRNFIVRKLQRQADRFSVQLGYGTLLQSGLIKISKENKGTIVNDPLYSVFKFSHPPLLQRLQLLEQQEQRKVKRSE